MCRGVVSLEIAKEGPCRYPPPYTASLLRKACWASVFADQEESKEIQLLRTKEGRGPRVSTGFAGGRHPDRGAGERPHRPTPSLPPIAVYSPVTPAFVLLLFEVVCVIWYNWVSYFWGLGWLRIFPYKLMVISRLTPLGLTGGFTGTLCCWKVGEPCVKRWFSKRAVWCPSEEQGLEFGGGKVQGRCPVFNQRNSVSHTHFTHTASI